MKRLTSVAVLWMALHAAGWSQQPATAPATGAQSPQPVVKPAHLPVPIKTVDPEMPQEARANGHSGICVVRVTIDVNGLPQNIQPLRCSDPVFQPNTLNAVSQYRFHPATLADGTPVTTQISIEVCYHFGLDSKGCGESGIVPMPRTGYAFSTPPGITSFDPDANGVYPLSKLLEQPGFKKLNDKGYAEAALWLDDGDSCSVLLTINAKGKPSDPQLLSCDKENMEKPVVKTLMNSQFKPAQLNGKPVAVRVVVRLVYKGFAPTK